MSLRHKPIAKLIIMGNTSLVFTNNSQLSDRTLINIYTQNQGIAITPIDMVSKWNFTSAISTGTTNAYMSLLLSMQDLIEGYNMNYDMDCSYYDQNGVQRDCKGSGILKNTDSKIYRCYIEFVTA